MQVCDYPQGRYGNAIFRYLASFVFYIMQKEHTMILYVT